MVLTGIIVILIIASCVVIGEYLTSGNGAGSTSPLNSTGPAPSATVTTVKTTPTAAVNKTVPATTPATTATPKPTPSPTPTPTPTQVFTTTQINDYFIDVAFGPNSPMISKFTSSTAKISITGMYDDSDVATLSSFEQQFNTYSTTLVLPSAPVQSTGGDIVVTFMPGSSLTSLVAETSYSSVTSKPVINTDANGTICSIYRVLKSYSSTSDVIYLNSDLPDNERAHYLVRGVLYYLGFPSNTGKYPNSIFYSQPNTVSSLSTIDWDVVQIMYGSEISNGMSLSTVEDRLYY